MKRRTELLNKLRRIYEWPILNSSNLLQDIDKKQQANHSRLICQPLMWDMITHPGARTILQTPKIYGNHLSKPLRSWSKDSQIVNRARPGSRPLALETKDKDPNTTSQCCSLTTVSHYAILWNRQRSCKIHKICSHLLMPRNKSFYLQTRLLYRPQNHQTRSSIKLFATTKTDNHLCFPQSRASGKINQVSWPHRIIISIPIPHLQINTRVKGRMGQCIKWCQHRSAVLPIDRREIRKSVTQKVTSLPSIQTWYQFRSRTIITGGAGEAITRGIGTRDHAAPGIQNTRARKWTPFGKSKCEIY